MLHQGFRCEVSRVLGKHEKLKLRPIQFEKWLKNKNSVTYPVIFNCGHNFPVPCRPTRPPRPSPVTYFPGSGAEVTSYLTTRRTTPSTTTRRTTRTTTTTRRTTTTKRTTTRKTTTTQKPSTTRRSTTRKTTFKPIQASSCVFIFLYTYLSAIFYMGPSGRRMNRVKTL